MSSSSPKRNPLLSVLFGGKLLGAGMVALAGATAKDVPSFDALGQFAGPTLTVVIVGVVLALIVARRVTAILLLAIACWLAFELAPQWSMPDDPPSIGVRPVRIYFDDIWSQNRHGEEIQHSITAADADVVALVQVSDLTAPFVRQALSRYRYHLESATAAGEKGSRRVILAARFPLKALPAPDGLSSPSVFEAQVGAAKPVRLVIVRLQHPWPYRGQDEILQQLSARLSGGRAAHAVVVGDFNATLSSLALRRFVHETGLTPLPVVFGDWPSIAPAPLRLGTENVMTGPTLTAFDRQLGPPNGSDHQPIVFELAPTAGAD
jgi:endonuclease/exonuclease/phosphatase (EEP) superfamily protein YafD